MTRSASTLILFTLLAVSSAEPKKPPARLDPLDQKVLDRINLFRKNAGLSPVAVDPKLSAGCRAHAAYLLKHFDHYMSKKISVHGEDPALEGYSKEGAAAAKSSDIHYVEPVEAIDGFIATLYHRIPVLNRDLKAIGLGYVKGTANPPWVTVVNVLDGLPPLTEKKFPPVAYPGENQKDVPVAFGGERPNPIPEDTDGKGGFPVTLTFYETVEVKDATAVMKDKSGSVIEVWLSTPEKTAQPDGQRNTVGLIAKEELAKGMTYTVTVTAKADGKPFTKTWSFTTVK